MVALIFLTFSFKFSWHTLRYSGVVIQKCSVKRVLLNILQNSYENYCQGVIQGIFEIGNCFWVHENRCPNFDKLKNKIFTKHLIRKHRANHTLPPMYAKYCKPVFQFVFVAIIDDFLHLIFLDWIPRFVKYFISLFDLALAL